MPLAIRASLADPHNPREPQRVHRRPTSRLGGGIIFVSYVAGVLVSAYAGQLPLGAAFTILACSLPVLVAGLFEDVTGRLTPRQRLLAAVLAALLAATIADGVVARIDLPFIDAWLGLPAIALLLTCFMVAGACNAINLIDGVHGLAGGIAFLMFLGLASVARLVGDHYIFAQAVIMTAVLGGFLLWNFPRGRIFMGDGGAYFVGFVYAQLAIQFVARNDSVSAWFVVMLAAYPITETLYSIYRRKVLQRTPSTQPDALHLHSLLFARVALPLLGPGADRDAANALVAPRLWLHAIACLCIAITFYDQGAMLGANLAAYVVFYHVLYQRILHLNPTAAMSVPAPVRRPHEARSVVSVRGE
jgi:UDP-N-acetylmuramyl pentapeptide phosphotransferase/UDP-N-acetylglucosamine-1-phosphate transferase